MGLLICAISLLSREGREGGREGGKGVGEGGEGGRRGGREGGRKEGGREGRRWGGGAPLTSFSVLLWFEVLQTSKCQECLHNSQQNSPPFESVRKCRCHM